MAKKDQKLPASSPDFAKRFTDKIDDNDLLIALTKPAHQDAFTDAYIRWQLTSFKPTPRLPQLDDRQFLKLMASAPGLLANPRANDDAVAMFEKAENASRLSDQDLRRLHDAWSELLHRAQIIETLNQPAQQWRAWVDEQLPQNGPRKLQWLIERCYSTISTGWSSRDVKGDLTKALRTAGAIAGPAGLTPQQRQMVAEQIQRLSGLRRRMIDDVAFLSSGKIDVTLFNAYVSDDDIQKWTALLNGEPVK